MNNQFQKMVQEFFTKYLSTDRGVSENTVKTYRDTFVQLFEYLDKNKNIRITKIKIEDLNYVVITDFLNWLETNKKVGVNTRNNRLAAIRSFFKYVSYHYPMYLDQCTNIMSIQNKKAESKPMNYLTIEATKHFFSTFNLEDKKDLRRLSIIALLYESGARVSELINIQTYELRLTVPYTLILHGKGKKTRIVPIDVSVINILKKYIEAYHIKLDDYLFLNSQGKKLNRKGITYILNESFKKAKVLNSSLYPEAISPHSLRHSKAMHLLEKNVNLVYIRDFLGHASVTTTEIYSKANPEIKRKHILESSERLIDKVDYTEEEQSGLLNWLKNNL